MPVGQGKLLFPCTPNSGLQDVFVLVPMTAALYGPQKASPVNARCVADAHGASPFCLKMEPRVSRRWQGSEHKAYRARVEHNKAGL